MLTLALFAILAAGAPGCTPGPVSYKGTIKVGVAAPLSGDLADGGQSVVYGVQLQADRINKEGGLLGYKIEVVEKDDEADDEVAVAVAEELVKEGVRLVVGHYNSGQSIAAAPIYAQGKVIQITPTSSDPALTQMNLRTVFRVAPTDAAQGPQLARFAIQKLGKTQIAVLNSDSDYARGLAAEFVKEAKALGVTPVLTLAIKGYADDYSADLAKVKAANPDLIFAAIDYPEAIVILRQKKEMGVPGGWLSGDATFQYETIQATGSASEGIYISSFVPSIRGLASEPAKEFIRQFRGLFNRNPGPDAVPGSLALEVWARAVKQAGRFDADAVIAAMQQLQFNAPITNQVIRYDSKGDLTQPVIYISQVKDGDFVAAEK